MKHITSSYILQSVSLDTQLKLEVMYLVNVNYTLKLIFNDPAYSRQISFCIRKDQVIDFINEAKNLSGDEGARLDDSDSTSFICLSKQGDSSNFDLKICLVNDLEDERIETDIVVDKSNVIGLLKYLISLLQEVDDIESEREYERKYLKRKLMIPEI